ncbi:Hypothetical protein GSB_103365 [Giardia duodenalis]|uniref:Uncharacterized protein n=2 Tax=Giardia intestinalis TaxID=5741 RepID=C6LT43_GIAIB|nr:Hypothetical protein GL50581_1936 [Giardia intestinalis ATCC 50581]ESU44766.1 Hypothetical protein GSB_103365 [Giardia intestinalis]
MALSDFTPLTLSKQVAGRMSYVYGGDLRARCIEHTLHQNCIRICEMALNLRKDFQRERQSDPPQPDFYAAAINNIEPISYYYMLPCNIPPCLPISSIKKRFLFRTLFDIHHFPGLYHVTELLETGVFDDYSEDEHGELNKNFGRSIPKDSKNTTQRAKKRLSTHVLHEIADIRLKGVGNMPPSGASGYTGQTDRLAQVRAKDHLMKQLNTIAVTTAMIGDADDVESSSKDNSCNVKAPTAAKGSAEDPPLLTIDHKQESIRLLENMLPCSIFDTVTQFIRRKDFKPPLTRQKWDDYSKDFLKKRSWGEMQAISYEQTFLICNILGVDAIPDFPDLSILATLICEELIEMGIEIIPEYEPIFHGIVQTKLQSILQSNSVRVINILDEFTSEDLKSLIIVTKGHRNIIEELSTSETKLLFRRWRRLTVTDYIVRSSEPTPESTLYSLAEAKSLGLARRKEKDVAENIMLTTMRYFIERTLPDCHQLIKDAICDFSDAAAASNCFVADIIEHFAKKAGGAEDRSHINLSELSLPSLDSLTKEYHFSTSANAQSNECLSEETKIAVSEMLTMLGKKAWMHRICNMYALVTKLAPFLHRTETSGIRVVPLSLTSYFVDYLGARASYLVSTEDVVKKDPLCYFTDGWTKYTQQSCNDLWYCPFPIDDRIVSHYTQLFHTIVMFAVALTITEPRVAPRELVYELGYVALFGLERSSVTAHVITGCKYLYATAVNCLNHTAGNIISDYFQLPNMTFVSGYLARRCLLYMQYYSSVKKDKTSSKSDNPLSESKYDENITKLEAQAAVTRSHSVQAYSTDQTQVNRLTFANEKEASFRNRPALRGTITSDAPGSSRSFTAVVRGSKYGTKTKMTHHKPPLPSRPLQRDFSNRSLSTHKTNRQFATSSEQDSEPILSCTDITKSKQNGHSGGKLSSNPGLQSYEDEEHLLIAGYAPDLALYSEIYEDFSMTDFQTRSLFSSKPVSARLCLQMLLMSSCLNGSLSVVDLLAESTINRRIENEIRALRVLTGVCISQSRLLYDNITSYGFQYISDLVKPPGARLYLRECKSENHIIDAEIRLIKLLLACRIPYAYSPSVVMAAGQLVFMDISGTRLLNSIATMNEKIVQLSTTERSVAVQPPCFLRGELPYSTSGGGIMVTAGLVEKKKILEMCMEDETFYIKSLLLNKTDMPSQTIPRALFPSWPTMNLYLPSHNLPSVSLAHTKIQEQILRDRECYGSNVKMNEAIFSLFTDPAFLNKHIDAENAELYCRIRRLLSSVCSIGDIVSLDWRLTSLLYSLSFSGEEFLSGPSQVADLTFRLDPDSQIITLSIRVGLFMQLQVEAEAISNCITIGMLIAVLQSSLDNTGGSRDITIYFNPLLVDHILNAIMSKPFSKDRKLTQRDVINMIGLTDPNNLQVAALLPSHNNNSYKAKLSSNIGHGVLTRQAEDIAELFLLQCPEHYGHNGANCVADFISLTTQAQNGIAAIHESATLSNLTESIMPTLFYTMLFPARRFLHDYFDSCAMNYMMAEEKLVIFEDGFVDALRTGYVTGVNPHRSGSAIRIHTNVDDDHFRWHSSLLHIGLIRLRKYLLDQLFRKEYQLNYAMVLKSHAMIEQTSRYTCLIIKNSITTSFLPEQLKEFIRVVINDISIYGKILCELASFNPLTSSTIISRAYAEFSGVYYMRGTHLVNVLEKIFLLCDCMLHESNLREKMLHIVRIGCEDRRDNVDKPEENAKGLTSHVAPSRRDLVQLPKVILRYLYRCMQKKVERTLFPSKHPIRNYFELGQETEATPLMPIVLGGLPPFEVLELTENMIFSSEKSLIISSNKIILADVLNRAIILRTSVDIFGQYNVGTIYRRFIKLYRLWKQYATYQTIEFEANSVTSSRLGGLGSSVTPIKGLLSLAEVLKAYDTANEASYQEKFKCNLESLLHEAASTSESGVIAPQFLEASVSDNIFDNAFLESIKEQLNNSLMTKLHSLVITEDDSNCRSRAHQLEMLSRRYWIQQTTTASTGIPLDTFLHFIARNSALAHYNNKNLGMTSLIYKVIEDVLDYDV